MEKKKYLIISGCSFTGHKVEPNIAWPNHLDNNYEIIDCSEMASGNALISRNLISNIPHYLDKDPTVIAMWSNPNRFELFYNKESNNYNKIYNDMNGNGGFQNQPVTGKWSSSENSNWSKFDWFMGSSILGILLFAALISYSPDDPNFIFPKNTEIKNQEKLYCSPIAQIILK